MSSNSKWLVICWFFFVYGLIAYKLYAHMEKVSETLKPHQFSQLVKENP